MRVLIDIGHPAHVHFFRHSITRLMANNHDVLITSRHKEIATTLLDDYQLRHKPLSHQRKGAIGLFIELIERDCKLLKVALDFKPHVMAGVGGIFVAHVGWLTRTPALVFYDTENARLQNALTYPFARKVIVPNCYQGKVPEHKTIRYAGYHELAYLHPNYFTPDRQVAIENGLAPEGNTFLLRLVSWEANHDLGETGWSFAFLERLLEALTPLGKVLISSEAPLPEKFASYQFQGSPKLMHHVLAFCRLTVGESATMCSEGVVLGVPGVYVAQTSRGYIDEQSQHHQLAANHQSFNTTAILQSITEFLSLSDEQRKQRHERLLRSSIDVSQFIIDQLESYAPSKQGLC